MVAADTCTQDRHWGCPGGGDLEARDGTAASGFTLLATKSPFQEVLVSLSYLAQKQRWESQMSPCLSWSQSLPPSVPGIFRLWQQGICSLGAGHLGGSPRSDWSQLFGPKKGTLMTSLSLMITSWPVVPVSPGETPSPPTALPPGT